MTERAQANMRVAGFMLAFLAQFAVIIWHSARTMERLDALRNQVIEMKAEQASWVRESRERLEADALNIELLKARMIAHEKVVP